MSRSSIIYVAMKMSAPNYVERIVAAFTVKYELVSWGKTLKFPDDYKIYLTNAGRHEPRVTGEYELTYILENPDKLLRSNR